MASISLKKNDDVDEFRKTLGLTLEKARLKTGKSAAQVSREAGVSVVTVRDVEMGIGSVKATTLEAMAAASGMNRDEMDALLAMAGQIRPELVMAMCKHPDRWQAMLDSLR